MERIRQKAAGNNRHSSTKAPRLSLSEVSSRAWPFDNSLADSKFKEKPKNRISCIYENSSIRKPMEKVCRYLNSFGLSGELPDISSMTGLQTMNLANDQFSGTIPTSLSKKLKNNDLNLVVTGNLEIPAKARLQGHHLVPLPAPRRKAAASC
ncbi:OLC1v1004150C1 [Oldenlandia corymbosa var. corymbosa]|uniref:OLC1v1004150C1 n=1 Tax=Oldenlandia corymbosa var. corymbosa TaxID=529605 RepID=A0AAV1DC98_OLDCO|nr:OLC1v1004150C1 [Oldenlandia corymbosa var. corymbosa]